MGVVSGAGGVNNGCVMAVQQYIWYYCTKCWYNSIIQYDLMEEYKICPSKILTGTIRQN